MMPSVDSARPAGHDGSNTQALHSAVRSVLAHPSAIPWLYLAAIAGAEAETGLGSLWRGLAMHCLILVALPLTAALAGDKPYRPLLLALVTAPLIRIMSLTLPLAGFPPLAWYVLVSIPVFVCTVMVAHSLGYDRQDLGLAWRGGRLQLVVVLSGPCFGWLESRILTVQGLASAASPAGVAPAALILLVCTGLMEELVFRGLLQRAAYGVFFDDGVLYVSLLFSVLHTGYRSPLDSLFVLAVGLVYAIVVRRTGSILGVTLSHGLANATLYVFVPLFWTAS